MFDAKAQNETEFDVQQRRWDFKRNKCELITLNAFELKDVGIGF